MTKPTIVDLPAKDDMRAVVDGLRRMLPALLENAELIAQIRRANYDALIAEGFTPDQALILCTKSTL